MNQDKHSTTAWIDSMRSPPREGRLPFGERLAMALVIAVLIAGLLAVLAWPI